jgi:hypothetical protein
VFLLGLFLGVPIPESLWYPIGEQIFVKAWLNFYYKSVTIVVQVPWGIIELKKTLRIKVPT